MRLIKILHIEGLKGFQLPFIVKHYNCSFTGEYGIEYGVLQIYAMVKREASSN